MLEKTGIIFLKSASSAFLLTNIVEIPQKGEEKEVDIFYAPFNVNYFVIKLYLDSFTTQNSMCYLL